MALFTFNNEGLAQPSASTALSPSDTDSKIIAVLAPAATAVDVNVDGTNATAHWTHSDDVDVDLGTFTLGSWNRMPNGANVIHVSAPSSGSHNVYVDTDGGVRTAHRTAAADSKTVYLRSVDKSGADA